MQMRLLLVNLVEDNSDRVPMEGSDPVYMQIMLQRKFNEEQNARRAKLEAQRQKEEQEIMRRQEEEYKRKLEERQVREQKILEELMNKVMAKFEEGIAQYCYCCDSYVGSVKCPNRKCNALIPYSAFIKELFEMVTNLQNQGQGQGKQQEPETNGNGNDHNKQEEQAASINEDSSNSSNTNSTSNNNEESDNQKC
jgi:hypothetical protein